MKTNPIVLLVSLIAVGIAAYATIVTNQLQNRLNSRTEAVLPTLSVERLATTGVSTQSNWLGSTGQIELRRGTRLDIIGGLDPQIVAPPRNFFDLAPADEHAANLLTATLLVPAVIEPHNPFTIKWRVNGPEFALNRINSYQLNVFAIGPSFNVPFDFTPISEDGSSMVEGTLGASMWTSGQVSLWAHFGSGIKEIVVKEVVVDYSNCRDTAVSLEEMRQFLEGGVAFKFLQGTIEKVEEIEEDATVTNEGATASYSNNGLTFQMDVKIEVPSGWVLVRCRTTFSLTPDKSGSLRPRYTSAVSRTVEVLDSDLPFLDDLWHFLTLSDHDFGSLQYQFSQGLKSLETEFATYYARKVRGLPEDGGSDEDRSQAPKIVEANLDLAGQRFQFTLCPPSKELIYVVGYVPLEVFQIEP